jgi:hypothetical protein
MRDVAIREDLCVSPRGACRRATLHLSWKYRNVEAPRLVVHKNIADNDGRRGIK